MKDEIPPTIIPVSSTTTRTSTTVKKDNSDAGLFAKTRYKFWVLAAILLLAFWSMFTGSVNLKWSAANLTRFSDDHDSRIHDDLDILVHFCLFLVILYYLLWQEICVVNNWFVYIYIYIYVSRKWRRERRWWSRCGMCTRKARVLDCLSFGRRLLKLLTSLWPAMFQVSETLPFRKSQKCP